MKDLPTLIDALCEAYDTPAFKPAGGNTFCNLAVNYVCQRMGYSDFKGLTANQIIARIKERPNVWTAVPMRRAQDIANEGHVVLAAVSLEPHGHVNLVRPGRMVWSQKWGKHAAKCMNVGQENFIGKGISFAFRNEPEFFALEVP